MEPRNTSDRPYRGKTPGHAKAVMLLQFVIVTSLSGWILVEYLHNTYLQDYVKTTITSNAFLALVAVPVGLLAIASSLYLQRRRDVLESRLAVRREQVLRQIKFEPTVLHNEPVPSRKMRVKRPKEEKPTERKTRPRERMSRNRAGERLPPDHSQN